MPSLHNRTAPHVGTLPIAALQQAALQNADLVGDGGLSLQHQLAFSFAAVERSVLERCSMQYCSLIVCSIAV